MNIDAWNAPSPPTPPPMPVEGDDKAAFVVVMNIDAWQQGRTSVRPYHPIFPIYPLSSPLAVVIALSIDVLQQGVCHAPLHQHCRLR